MRVPIPETFDRAHPAIGRLVLDPGMLVVSSRLRERALLVVQALADEARRRSHALVPPATGDGTFQIDIGDDSFTFVLLEEVDRLRRPDPEQAGEFKYSWQRARTEWASAPSGRLALRLDDGSHTKSWADRKRWRLEDRLSHVMVQIEGKATEARAARRRVEFERAERRSAWEVAIQDARRQFVVDLNRRRVEDQCRSSALAGELEAYARRLEAHASTLDADQERQRVLEWAMWAQSHSVCVDPIADGTQLSFSEPTEIATRELDRFMPRGMSATSPPD